MLKANLRDPFTIKRVNKKVVLWQGCPPEKVHYGIGVTMDQIDDYAHKHNIHNPKRDYTIFNLPVVVERLAELTDCPNLYWKIIFSLDHDIVLAMYDNYTQRRLEMVPEDEKEVLEIIRKELAIEPEQDAMWYICITSQWCVGPLHSLLWFNRIVGPHRCSAIDSRETYTPSMNHLHLISLQLQIRALPLLCMLSVTSYALILLSGSCTLFVSPLFLVSYHEPLSVICIVRGLAHVGSFAVLVYYVPTELARSS